MKGFITGIVIGIVCLSFFHLGKLEVRNNLQEEVESFTGVNPEYLIELDNDSIIIFGVGRYYSEDKIYKLPIDSKISIGEFFIKDNL
jgi:hypothetical protein